MNEKLQAQLKLLLNYIDYIMIVVFLGLLLLTFYLYDQEKKFSLPDQGTVPENPWQVKFDTMAEDEQVVDSFMKVNPDIRQDEKARRLVQVNMFDSQSIKEQIRVEEAVREDYNQAEIAFNNGNYDRAKQLAESILQRYPVHLKSQRLLQQIEEKVNGESAEGTTPADPSTPQNTEVPQVP